MRIREKARQLFEAAGIADPFHPGVRTEAEVNAFLEHHGFVAAGDLAFKSDVRLTLRDFIARIVNGECSYTWSVPSAVQQTCVPTLAEWARKHFDLNSVITTPMCWKVFRRPEHRDATWIDEPR